MKIFLAVVDELYSFLVESLFMRPQKLVEISEEENPDQNRIDFHAYKDREETEELDTLNSVPEFRSIGDIAADITEEPVKPIEKNTIMYIGGSETPMYINPTREFDSVLVRLPYGAMVVVLGQNGRWTQVVFDSFTGWVLRDELLDRAAYVYPQFVVGEKNTVDDTNTIRIRAILNDTFAGGSSEMDLRSSEYVQYRLVRKGITIPWSTERPRTEGVWHRRLKGADGIHVGVAPKPGSIMEYMIDEDRGQLAYVEAVFPEDTIDISEVTFAGEYTERTLTNAEWKELKPIFIEVT